MLKSILKVLFIFLLFSSMEISVNAVSFITEQRRAIERFQYDPLALRSLNSTFDNFPDSSLVDFSYLLDAPAGKHGPVITGDDGNFYFQNNGQRIRFWGMTIAASHVDVPKERIREVIDVLARAGVNMLRLHELDNRGAERYHIIRRNIINEAYPHQDSSRYFDKEYRDRVDYWIYNARKRGMYVYLVLRGFRTFREGDGVDNAAQLERAAKPYAFFNRRLIELQKEYAQEWLINHINPYTGMPNGLDPAIAMIEIANEDSLFFTNEPWNDFIEPYRTEFIGLWNQWLKEKYSTTDALRKAWTNQRGESALLPDESLEKMNISLPDMPLHDIAELANLSGSDPRTAPLKCNDGARFAVSVQRKYFAEIRDFLRSLGIKAPMTSVVNGDYIPDTHSVAMELDFVAENAYLDHPSFLPGEQWVGIPSYRNINYIREVGQWSLMSQISKYKWANKPLVVREWATCWPNRYRVSSFLDIAAYALLQDYDGLIHFCYNTWGNMNINGPFAPQADPTRWGLSGYAAKLFIEGHVEVAQQLIELQYTHDDIYTWGRYKRDFYSLAWTHRIQNRYMGKGEILSNADIQIPAGRALSTRTNKTDKDIKTEIRDNADTPNILISETGELYRDIEKGYMLINTPMFQAIQGEFIKNQPYETGNLRILSQSTIGSIVVTALDGKPLSESNRIAMKMATISINRGEILEAITTGTHAGRFALRNPGGPPVQTLGQATDEPTRIYLNNQPFLDIYMENGTWEIVLDKAKNELLLYCDTPNIKFRFYQNSPTGWQMQKYFYEFPPKEPLNIENTFFYPGFAKYIHIMPGN